MSLSNLLDMSDARNKEVKATISPFEVTEERALASIDDIRRQIAFYREYPDLFIDFMKGPNSKFKFYFYQRVNV